MYLMYLFMIKFFETSFNLLKSNLFSQRSICFFNLHRNFRLLSKQFTSVFKVNSTFQANLFRYSC